MKKEIPSIGHKPKSADPGDYLEAYSRSKKEVRERRDDGLSASRKKLLPSSKPVNFGVNAPDSSLSGYGYLVIVFFLTILVFIVLMKLRG